MAYIPKLHDWVEIDGQEGSFLVVFLDVEKQSAKLMRLSNVWAEPSQAPFYALRQRGSANSGESS